MPAYFVANLHVTNPEGFEAYRQQVPATVERYGGRYLVRGNPEEAIEGGPQFERLVIIEFPSVADAKRWYESEEYQALLPLRFENARTEVSLVEGLPR